MIRTKVQNVELEELYSDCDEEELIAAAIKVETEYMERTKQDDDSNEIGQNKENSNYKEVDKSGSVFKCDLCGKHYTRMNNLKRHIESHNVLYSCACG